MDNLVPIELLADPITASYVIEKGSAEIVTRRIDKKFRSFVMCKIMNSEGIEQQAAKTILEEISSNSSVEEMRAIYSHPLDKNEIVRQNLSVFNKTNVGKYVPYLSSLLSVADLAVDIAGFQILANKINEQYNEIKAISDRIGEISASQKNEKIGTLQNLIMRSNLMSDKLDQYDQIDLDTFQELLIDLRTFITEMIGNWSDSWYRDIALNIIFTLFPSYSFLLGEFLKNFYFQKERLPKNYSLFMSLFEELEEEEFLEQLFDYYLLEKKIPIIDAQDIVYANIAIVREKRLQVEQELNYVRTFDRPEEYYKQETILAEDNQERFSLLAKELLQKANN